MRCSSTITALALLRLDHGDVSAARNEFTRLPSRFLLRLRRTWPPSMLSGLGWSGVNKWLWGVGSQKYGRRGYGQFRGHKRIPLRPCYQIGMTKSKGVGADVKKSTFKAKMSRLCNTVTQLSRYQSLARCCSPSPPVPVDFAVSVYSRCFWVRPAQQCSPSSTTAFLS